MRRKISTSSGLDRSIEIKNMALVNPDPQGPDRGVVLAAHLIRAFSVLIGAVTVWAAYALSRQTCPAPPV